MKALTRTAPSENGTGPIHPPPRPAKDAWRYWAAAAVLLVAGLALASALRPKPGPAISTAAIVRQTLVATVTATGTVNPQDTISVGTQVSGTILTIDADYNDRVRKGQVLARLDPTLFQAALDQARSNLAQARAQWQSTLAATRGANASTVAAVANAAASEQDVRVAQAAIVSDQAGVVKAQAALELARQTVARDRELLAAGFIAQSQFDTDASNQVAAESALRSATVTTSQARMQLAAARNQATAGAATGSASNFQAAASSKTAAANLAAIAAMQAQVRQAEINLGHTVITSPVDGTVIARNVSLGQTVAASFQTPTLFTIAKDITKMEIDFAVGEPDIGAVRADQGVDFTVLAYPNDTFHGRVAQVRENPTTLQNVVTYDTVVYETNPGNRLMPGMTANASIDVAHADGALVVPLAALSFRAASGGPKQSAGPAPRATQAATTWGNAGSGVSTTLSAGNVAQLTLVQPGKLVAVPVRIVLVSAGQAAIEPIGRTLEPGTLVAVSLTTQQAQAAARAPGMFR